MSGTSFSFKNNLTIDNGKYLKWLNSTGLTRNDIIGVDNLNNLNINSAQGSVFLNSNNSGSNTFLNVNNTSNVIVASKLGVGFSSTSNISANLTLAKNGYIGVNTTQGSDDGYLGLTGSYALNSTSGSRMIMYANNNTSGNGQLRLYSGDDNAAYIGLYTGNDAVRFQVDNSGTSYFTPNGSTVVFSVADAESMFTNNVVLASTDPSTGPTSGALTVAGGIGVAGDVNVSGTLNISDATGNLNFSSTEPSTSYTSASLRVAGGMSIATTSNATGISAGGAISVAGGVAIAKDMYVGGSVVILDSTVSSSAQTGSLVLYGGMGINNAVLSRTNNGPQIRLAPVTNGTETSIAFYATNNFSASETGGSTTWTIGQNVGGIGSGNFGIYSPGNGTLITVTNAGKVGIGTTSPNTDSLLHVNGNALLEDITTGSINFTGNLFQNGVPYVGSQWSGSSGSLFYIGNVGVNTTTVTSTLTVNGDANIIGGLTAGNINFTGSLFQNGFPYVGSQWIGTSGNIYFSGGNVGIGTTNPQYQLDIYSSTYSKVRLKNDVAAEFWVENPYTLITLGTYASVGNIYDATGYVYCDTNLSLQSRSANLWVCTNGNVGIGTATPAGQLDIYSSTYSYVRLNNDDGADYRISTPYGYVSMGVSQSTGNVVYDGIGYVYSDKDLSLQSGNAELRVCTNGNVGIGVTSPSSILHVNGTITATAYTGGSISIPTGSIASLTTLNASTTNMTAGDAIVTNTLTVGGAVYADSLSTGMSTVFSGTFVGANNVAVPTDVTGLAFNNSSIRNFSIQLAVTINATSGNLYESFTIDGTQTDAGWTLFVDSIGDVTGVEFYVTNSGQVQYTSTNITSWTSTTFRYTATTLAATGSYNSLSVVTNGNLLFDTIQLNSTADAVFGGNNGALYSLGGGTFAKSVVIRSSNDATGVGTGGSLTVMGGAAIASNLVVGTGITSQNITTNSLVATSSINGASFQNELGSLRLRASNTQGTVFLATNGNVGINTTLPSYQLHVEGDIYATGAITAFSDSRLKTNIATINHALETVSKLRGVTYTSKNTNRKELGVVAQEIQQVLPEVVVDKGEYLGVAYGNIVGVLIEAVKELRVKVTILEEQLNIR